MRGWEIRIIFCVFEYIQCSKKGRNVAIVDAWMPCQFALSKKQGYSQAKEKFASTLS